MHRSTGLSVQEIATIFTEETAAAGGSVKDSWSDDTRIIMRSVLPMSAEVLPRDCVQAGVALSGRDTAVVVHPYLFRKICLNGTIMAIRGRGSTSQRLDQHTAERAAGILRQAVHACCDEGVFRKAVKHLRASALMPVVWDQGFFERLELFRASGRASMLNLIASRFRSERDRSRYGLVNAITSVARDTVDQAVRWELEKLGGDIASDGIPVGRPDPVPKGSCGASQLITV
jgi:hypothetical protein